MTITERKRVRGESLVWLTATGLAVGLVMVVGLLWVIIHNGIGAFWPQTVIRVVLDDGSVALGSIMERREKHDPEGKGAEEILVYTGNKELAGGFRWIDAARIVREEPAAGALVIERLEQGSAVGLPLRLTPRGGEPPLPASDAAFSSVLDRAVATHTQRRERINQLVKNDISTNLKRAKEIEERLKTLDAPEATTLRHELATLATAYKTLVAEVADLRKQQKATILELQVADGSIMPVPVAQMVGVTRPNELGWFGRLGLCLNRMWHFLADNPRESNTEGGIFPAIFGTFAMTLLMSLAVTPLGVVAAIYLREYARQGPVVRAVRIAVNNLAGVPSIVFGVFGMGFFVLIVGGSIDQAFFSAQLPNPTFGTGGILWASLTLALMTVPVVIVATEESVAAVPRGMKEGSLACGASKWQTIQRIVLPAAVPGILTGLILAMARGAGEVAPLMLVGVVKNATSFPITGEWPFVHLDQKFMHLGFHIYDLGFQSPDSDAAKPMVFATTLFLIVLVLVLNLGAIILRDRLRKRFATGAF